MVSADDLAKRASVILLKSLPASYLLVERPAATSRGSGKQRIGVPKVPRISALPFLESFVCLWFVHCLFGSGSAHIYDSSLRGDFTLWLTTSAFPDSPFLAAPLPRRFLANRFGKQI
jgi:hypothetical protein